MKTIVTMTVNPSIDKSTRVAHVTAEQKLYCKPPRLIRESLVISLGAAGDLMVSERGAERLIPPTVPIVSKVGAGDSMVSGVAQ